MPEKSNTPEKKIYVPHPKTELCLALNLARHRFVEILKYILKNDTITEDNWKTKITEFNEADKVRKPTGGQQKLIEELAKYLPFVRPENDRIIEIRMVKKIGGLLSGQRNFYSHDKHKPIILPFDKEKAHNSEIKKLCDLFAGACEALITDEKNNTYIKEDIAHLLLKDDRKDETAPGWLSPYIAKTIPDETEYALFFKAVGGYELSERGAMFLASLFLDKKEANEFLSGMTGFRKTEGNKFKATRDVFTYYSGKVIYERDNTQNADVSLFFNMVSYLDKKPECIPASEGEEVRVRDLFGHFAIRYLLMDNDDIKVRQYTGKKVYKERVAVTKKGLTIPVTETDEEKIYSGDLEQKFALTGNNIYFEYKGEKGEMGFKALSQFVFAKLLRNEKGYGSIFDDVKKSVHKYLVEYKAILNQIKSGAISSPDSLQEKLIGKIVKLEEIPQAIQNAFGKTLEDNDVFVKRVLKRLENRIKECDEKITEAKTAENKPRIYDMVTFMLHDFMDSRGRDNKPGKGLYERLHYDFTFYGRFKGKLIDTLRNKYSDFNNSILFKALEKDDLHDVYSEYLVILKKQLEGYKNKLENETAIPRKLQNARDLSFKLGMSQKSYESKSADKHKRTSSAKDISDMLLDKPIPLPGNLISKAILDVIKITKDGKEIDRLGTLIDIYLTGKGFDAGRSDKDKNVMLAEYYQDLDNKYKGITQKKIRLSRTHDKLIRLMVGEYAKGFIKNSVTLLLPDEKPVKDLYRSEVIMDFFGRKIKFPFDKYNKVKKLLYDKRIGVIIKHHIDNKIKQLDFTDDTEKKFIIDEEKELYKKSQKRLISEALKFEKRFWENNNFEFLLSKYSKYISHIEHKNILAESKADAALGKFRNNALHNDVPETQGYFKNVFEKYGKL